MEEKEQYKPLRDRTPHVNNKIKLQTGVIKGPGTEPQIRRVVFHVSDVRRSINSGSRSNVWPPT